MILDTDKDIIKEAKWRSMVNHAIQRCSDKIDNFEIILDKRNVDWRPYFYYYSVWIQNETDCHDIPFKHTLSVTMDKENLQLKGEELYNKLKELNAIDIVCE